MLTQERLKEVIHYDPETGVMKWIAHRQRPDMVGKRLGSVDNNGYIKVWIDGKQYRVHRLAFLYMTGSFPKIADHLDGVTSNNKFSNLRDATKSINGQNMKRARKDNLSGFLGVSTHKKSGKFDARIHTDGVGKYIGRFDTAELAHSAYIDEKRKIHKGNTL